MGDAFQTELAEDSVDNTGGLVLFKKFQLLGLSLGLADGPLRLLYFLLGFADRLETLDTKT